MEPEQQDRVRELGGVRALVAAACVSDRASSGARGDVQAAQVLPVRCCQCGAASAVLPVRLFCGCSAAVLRLFCGSVALLTALLTALQRLSDGSPTALQRLSNGSPTRLSDRSLPAQVIKLLKPPAVTMTLFRLAEDAAEAELQEKLAADYDIVRVQVGRRRHSPVLQLDFFIWRFYYWIFYC